jgi:hypothetical protein
LHYVEIGDAIGDIVEKALLVTRIRTPKNVVITIPYVAPGFKISPVGNFFHPSESEPKANEQKLAEGQN